MTQRSRLRLPWEKDPNDREGNYRKPIAQAEKTRLLAKAAAVVGAFLFIRDATGDGKDVGAEFGIGIGAALVIAGVLDLVWTFRGELEHVFIDSRPLQLLSHGAVAVAGLTLLAGGLIARGT